MQQKIRMWLSSIVQTGRYNIVTLDYCEGCFGNYYIIIESNTGIQIQIIKDRGVQSCNIKTRFSTWTSLAKLFEDYKIATLVFPALDEEYFKYICQLLLQYEDILTIIAKKHKRLCSKKA